MVESYADLKSQHEHIKSSDQKNIFSNRLRNPHGTFDRDPSDDYQNPLASQNFGGGINLMRQTHGNNFTKPTSSLQMTLT